MKIGIDARQIHHRGVGRYIKELIRHLGLIDQENDYFIYFSSKKDLEEYGTNIGSFTSIYIPTPALQLHRQPLLINRLRKDRLNVFHVTDHWFVPLFSFCPVITTVHDLMVKTYPDALSFMTRIYSLIMTSWAFKKSSNILTVSEFNKKECLKYYPGSKQKTSVIYHGINKDDFFPLQEDGRIKVVKNKYGLETDYFLFVGSLLEYKNLSILMKAFAQLPLSLRFKYHLVIAAKIDSRYDHTYSQTQNLGIKDQVHFLNFVSTADLVALYNAAIAFVTTSLYESFCFPMLEAMACGTPVIASDTMAFSEIAGNAALLVDPSDAVPLRESMVQIIEDQNLRKSLSQKGIQRAQAFSWTVTAQKTRKIYEKYKCFCHHPSL
ncbi:MAG: glycosyltransferase family 4 protein [Desulfobacteraceae bacterium]|nr:glycosyltransferase family 4 protein [Desulfobacteraceae bacterium]MBC2718448.1 glycosyltransferase family 4 protein [Desulfobacteraceae bacterium]